MSSEGNFAEEHNGDKLAFTQAERWVELRIDLRDIDFQVGLSPCLFEAVRGATGTFDAAVGAPEIGQPALDEQARPWRVQRITPDFTSVLGVLPARGSDFAADTPLDHGLLLSDRVWREGFGADANIVGRLLRIGNTQYQIQGVMPPGFAWPDADVQAWTPWLASSSEREQDAQGGFGQFHVAARLAPGVNLVQAQQTLSELLKGSSNRFLASETERVRAQVRRWRDRFTAGHLSALLLLQAAAGLLLLVAAANLTGLTLDRLWSNRHGYTIRAALGARAGDLWRLILADLLLPTALGTGLGLALTPLAIDVLATRGCCRRHCRWQLAAICPHWPWVSLPRCWSSASPAWPHSWRCVVLPPPARSTSAHPCTNSGASRRWP